MKTTILIGTSGYSYQDWVGPVYPPGTAQKDFLKSYSQLFNFTEVNFSYYKQPDSRTLERMLHVVGDDFRFAIKVHQSLTHKVTADFQRDAAQFKEGIRPLVEASQLSAVVMQFPFSFHYAAASRTHLDRVCRAFEGLPVAVEFRNGEWQKDSVNAGLKKRGVALINVDEPLLPGLLKPSALVTAPFGYVRFHGRNAADWWQGDNASRYDYRYSEDELSEWVPRIVSMAKSAKSGVMVLFNNHWKGQAVENAKAMMKLLDASPSP